MSLKTPTSQLLARRQQRGAAIFIVILAIVLITAIGIFSARAAGMVDISAGYSRQAAQAQYMADYGGRATITVLGGGAANTYVQQMQSSADTCAANQGLAQLLPTGAVPPCYKLYMSELSQSLSGHTIQQPTTTVSGSLGPPDDSQHQLLGDFVVEMTDPGLGGAPLAGFNAGGTDNSFRLVQIVLTSQGLIRPWTSPTGTTCNITSTRGAGVSFLRAHVTTMVSQ